MGWLARLIAGPFGTIVTWIIVAVVATGVGFAAIKIHDHNIRVEAEIKANADLTKRQIDQATKEIQDLNGKLNKLDDIAKKLDESFNKLNEQSDNLANTIKETLAQKNIKDSGDQAPETLKETLRQLRGGK